MTTTISPIPDELVNEWVYKIYNRRQPSLDRAISRLIPVINHYPQILSEQHMKWLYNALEHLLDETDMKKVQNQNNKDRSLISIDYIPAYRALSSQLAYSLYQLTLKQKQETLKILNMWKDKSLLDPLPEVKKVWTSPRQGI